MQRFSFSIQTGILSILIITAGAFMLFSAYEDAPIQNEPLTLISGYSILRHQDAHFNPTEPLAPQMLSSVPLLFKKNTFDGASVLYMRISSILLTLLLIAFIYHWAQELVGRWWGLLPAFLISFSPLVLAHGHYGTNIIAGVVSGTIALRYCIQFLTDQSKKNLIISGVAFGIAQACSFGNLILIPYSAMIALLYAIIFISGKYRQSTLWEQYKKLVHHCTFLLLHMLLIIGIGYAFVVYPIYQFGILHYPHEDQIHNTETILQKQGPTTLSSLTLTTTQSTLLRPFGLYLFGLTTTQQSPNENIFFLGKLSAHVTPLAPFISYAMKETLPALFLVAIAGILGLLRILWATTGGFKKISLKMYEYLTISFSEFALIIFIFLYTTALLLMPRGIDASRILPLVPPLYIIAGLSLRKWFSTQQSSIIISTRERILKKMHELFNTWVKISIVSACALWLIIEISITAPFFLSYFNELSGGSEKGYKQSVRSNYDLGQDLTRLALWVSTNLEPEEKIALDYFGDVDPVEYIHNQYVPWNSAAGNPKNENIGWFAVSVTNLQEGRASLSPDVVRKASDEYLWLTSPDEPFTRAGTSIFIYKL
ncbi:MAG: glycosyltransferase family 39 protein [bacterium]|nr:glycosyltransferase family 39 protein [bacterium]